MRNDFRSILCVGCCDSLEVEADISAEGLDGRAGHCDRCGNGAFRLNDDEGHCWADFFPAESDENHV